MKSINPVLNEKVFKNLEVPPEGQRMTVNGTVIKTAILFLIMVVATGGAWYYSLDNESGEQVITFGLFAFFGGLLIAALTIFIKSISPYTVPIYSFCQGVILGMVSAICDGLYPGVVIQAIGLTFCTFFLLLIAYQKRWFKNLGPGLVILVGALGAVILLYVIELILLLIGYKIPFIHEWGIIAPLLSIVIVALAAINLVEGFEFIEKGIDQGCPKHMEWYGAFILIVALMYLYVSILDFLIQMKKFFEDKD